MAILNIRVHRVEVNDGALAYGRYRIVRQAAADDQITWKGAGGTGATHRVWSWRTGPWRTAKGEKILKIADVLSADEVSTYRSFPARFP